MLNNILTQFNSNTRRPDATLVPLHSGCLMALIFSLSVVNIYFYFNPVGYVFSQGLLALLQVGHSR